MTRLELANKIRRKTGTPGTFTTTLSQTGEAGDLIDWLDQAYQFIQDYYDTWLFLRDDFSFNTVSGTSEYSATGIASDYASWYDGGDDYRCYLTATGTTDEQRITFIDWDTFKTQFMFGSSRDSTGRPSYWTIAPDKAIHLYPTPDDIYTVLGEYFKVPDTMDADTDEPIFPGRYHWGIVWKALELYGEDSGEVNKAITGNKYFRQFIMRMSQHLLPELDLGGPLVD